MRYIGSRWELISVLGQVCTVRMQRNRYFWDSTKSSDIVIRFSNPEFLTQNNTLTIRRRLRVFFHCTNRQSAIYLFPVLCTKSKKSTTMTVTLIGLPIRIPVRWAC